MKLILKKNCVISMEKQTSMSTRVHRTSLVSLFRDEQVVPQVFGDFQKPVAVAEANIVDNQMHFGRQSFEAN